MPCIPSASDITSLYLVQPASNPSNPSTPNIKKVETAMSVGNVFFLKNSTSGLPKDDSTSRRRSFRTADSPYSLYSRFRRLLLLSFRQSGYSSCLSIARSSLLLLCLSMPFQFVSWGCGFTYDQQYFAFASGNSIATMSPQATAIWLMQHYSNNIPTGYKT